MKKTILSTRTSAIFLLIFLACGILIGFQNCSLNSSNGSITKTAADSLPLEINTTKAINIRFDSSYRTLNSGESIELVAHAEDENGDIVSDFNYSGIVKIQNSSDSFISICGGSAKFVNGVFRSTVSILNNYTTTKNLTFEIQSTVPVASSLTLSVVGQTEEIFNSVATAGASPAPRSGSTAIYDALKNRIVLFGGREIYEYYGYVQDGEPLNDLWELKLGNDILQWNNVTPSNSPSPRYGHTFVLDTINNRVLLFGGADLTSLASTDIWSFDLANDSWALVTTNNTPPRQRMNHSSTYDSNSKFLYIWGGTEANPSNAVPGSYVLKLGGSTPNWSELPLLTQPRQQPPYPITVSSTVAIIYDNSQVSFYNSITQDGGLRSSDVNYCSSDTAVPYGCITAGYSTVLDTTQKAQWVIGAIAERAPPRLPQQNYQQYKPVLKVLKKIIRSKLECAP
jgi:hypothetical protein